ncbi:MAG: sigma-54 dependent transcriptional regulator [Desulfobacteraceae bacterium]|jgi:DNA-binding NtrC family response regulator
MAGTSKPKFSLLFVDDDPAILSSLKRVFFEEDYQLHAAESAQDALELLSQTVVDAALVDLKMPGMDGMTLLKVMRADYPDIMVMMLTGHGGIKEAVEAIKLGAIDFLEKPVSPEGLRTRLAQLHRLWELREENRDLRSQIDSQFGFDRLVGNSPVMAKLKQTIANLGPTDVSILIQGETGTGKELVARAIHDQSHRSEYHFVPVDCAAISETVMESELFGHVRGAFTGAHVSTLGLIRSAHEGTLFLDEVGELSSAIQAKLLRTIQEKEVRPVGSNKSYEVDVRILAATNLDLSREVSLGNFREDLFYRLNVVAIHVHPLRERKEDIPILARHFLERFRGDSSRKNELSIEALICLEGYDWPGNIRELENVIRRAMALGKDETIRPEDLPPNISALTEKALKRRDRPPDDSLAAYEKAAIQNALAKADRNRKKAAQILGIGEATLYRKIKKYRSEV